MKISGIYKIQSKIKPERIYIGSSINIHKRWIKHASVLKGNIHENIKLQNHYNKYGKEDFVFSVLLGCEKEDLISTEQYFLDSYKPFFNIRIKADSCLGIRKSEEHKRKLRLAWKFRKPMTDETKKRMSLAKIGNKSHLGMKPTKETCEKIRAKAKGRIPSTKARRKSSLSQMGDKNHMFGKHMSESAKEKGRQTNLLKKLKNVS